MNTKDYTYLLNKPYALNDRQTTELESILTEFPYLQSARAIYLKGLYNRDSFRYNTELKKTAAYTTDRAVLFDFITSEEFRSIDRKLLDESINAVANIEVNESVTLKNTTPVEVPADKLEQSIKLSIKEAAAETFAVDHDESTERAKLPTETEHSTEITVDEPVNSNIESVTEVKVPDSETQDLSLEQKAGSPLDFSESETHSFAEWLQLSKLAPIQRDEPAQPIIVNEELDKKYILIDKFIEANPKIAPVKKESQTTVNSGKTGSDSPGLMTETLARVYLEQKKYAKAIQAYEILILKYPEKSVFFADRILEVKNLQQNINKEQ